jgi:hypothetical protein
VRVDLIFGEQVYTFTIPRRSDRHAFVLLEQFSSAGHGYALRKLLVTLTNLALSYPIVAIVSMIHVSDEVLTCSTSTQDRYTGCPDTLVRVY